MSPSPFAPSLLQRSYVATFVVLAACSTAPRHSDENNYRCDSGDMFNVILDTSARTAILRIPNSEPLVLPRAPGGPAERYSDGSMTLERTAQTLRLLRNEQVIAQGCRIMR